MNAYLSWEIDLLDRIEKDGTTHFLHFLRPHFRNSGIFRIQSGDFQPTAALKAEICNSETVFEFERRRFGGFFAPMV